MTEAITVRKALEARAGALEAEAREIRGTSGARAWKQAGDDATQALIKEQVAQEFRNLARQLGQPG